MKFPRIEVGYNIIFNNTGFDWTDIQTAVCEIVEKKYGTLHCITSKYHEENNIGAVRYEIKGVWCLFYFKVNTDSLAIDVIAIKEDNRQHIEKEKMNDYSYIFHYAYMCRIFNSTYRNIYG